MLWPVLVNPYIFIEVQSVLLWGHVNRRRMKNVVSVLIMTLETWLMLHPAIYTFINRDLSKSSSFSPSHLPETWTNRASVRRGLNSLFNMLYLQIAHREIKRDIKTSNVNSLALIFLRKCNFFMTSITKIPPKTKSSPQASQSDHLYIKP